MERNCKFCPVGIDKPCFKKEIDNIVGADIEASVKNKNISWLREIYRPEGCKKINYDPIYPDRKKL